MNHKQLYLTQARQRRHNTRGEYLVPESGSCQSLSCTPSPCCKLCSCCPWCHSAANKVRETRDSLHLCELEKVKQSRSCCALCRRKRLQNDCESYSRPLPLQLFQPGGRRSLCPGGRWAAVWWLHPWSHWCWTAEPALTDWHRNRSSVSPLQTDEQKKNNTHRIQKQSTSVCCWFLFPFLRLIWTSSVHSHHFVRILVGDVGVVGPWRQRARVWEGDDLGVELIQEFLRLLVHVGPHRCKAAEKQQRWNHASRHVGCFRTTLS